VKIFLDVLCSNTTQWIEKSQKVEKPIQRMEYENIVFKHCVSGNKKELYKMVVEESMNRSLMNWL
jgi:hypothetical protein